MGNWIDLMTSHGEDLFGSFWPLVWSLAKILIIVLPIFGAVAYLTLWERKLIGWMHIRLGPNRVGPLGCRMQRRMKFLLMERITTQVLRMKTSKYSWMLLGGTRLYSLFLSFLATGSNPAIHFLYEHFPARA